MVYRTLHGYIFRELLRVFLLTASALTTLMAFGGTFRPFTKQGIELSQLMTIMFSLMPAMLAYAIPIAALFAAVLVYWRMSTDNELTACRASGISFVAMVMPALLLGLAVASTDLVFVNYVVPVFLQRTERAIISDSGSLLVSQVGRQEPFKFNDLVIYADAATQEPSIDPRTDIVVLKGMAVTILKDNRPTEIGVARQAKLTITNLPEEDAAQVTVDVKDAAAFNAKTFQKVSGSVTLLNNWFDGKPLRIPSLLKSKPKFLNFKQLMALNENATKFPPVMEVVKRITNIYMISRSSETLYTKWTSTIGTKEPQEFIEPAMEGGPPNVIRVYAPRAELSADKVLTYLGTDGAPVRVEHWIGKTKTVEIVYRCDAVEVQMAIDEISNTGMSAALELKGHVQVENLAHHIRPMPAGTVLLSGIPITPPVLTQEELSPVIRVSEANNSSSPRMAKLGAEATDKMKQLDQTIGSELHSRGSFSLSCLMLVLLGAGLGISMRGKNPLAVFVVGFVPAIFLMLLITAGRQVAEGNYKNFLTGISLIWFGNLVLFIIVSAVYAKLLRH